MRIAISFSPKPVISQCLNPLKAKSAANRRTSTRRMLALGPSIDLWICWNMTMAWGHFMRLLLQHFVRRRERACAWREVEIGPNHSLYGPHKSSLGTKSLEIIWPYSVFETIEFQKVYLKIISTCAYFRSVRHPTCCIMPTLINATLCI